MFQVGFFYVVCVFPYEFARLFYRSFSNAFPAAFSKPFPRCAPLRLLCTQILVVGCVLIGSVPDGVSPPFHLHVQFLLCFPLNLLRPNVIIFLRNNDMTC